MVLYASANAPYISPFYPNRKERKERKEDY